MRGGHLDAITRRLVAGWAADPEQPDERLVVSISVDGEALGQAVADRPRQDLARLGRYGDGAHAFTFTFPRPLDPAVEHSVSVRFADDGALLPNGEHRIPALGEAATARAPAAAKPAEHPPLTPIIVTAPGRSGTTLLMRLLAGSPAVVAAELVPYELRLLSYHSAAYHILTQPADLQNSTHPDRLEGDGYHIGFNPFHNVQYNAAFRDRGRAVDYFDNYVPARVAACAREQISEYYQRLARDRGKSSVRFFAEKGNNLHKPTRDFTRMVFGQVRELVIVRDPRDVLCSHMSYFSSSAEKAFAQLTHASQQLLAIRREKLEDAHFLKYEEMVAGSAACFEPLSAFLGTDISAEGAEERVAMFKKHGTSETPEASVERWRTNLPDDLKARCAQDWGHFLTTFGYALK